MNERDWSHWDVFVRDNVKAKRLDVITAKLVEFVLAAEPQPVIPTQSNVALAHNSFKDVVVSVEDGLPSFASRTVNQAEPRQEETFDMQTETSTRAPQPESQPKEWRTVIVGLPIIRKLLNGEDVEIETFRINLIPDDVLWNNQPKRDAAGQAAPATAQLSEEQVCSVLSRLLGNEHWFIKEATVKLNALLRSQPAKETNAST